MIKNEKGEFFDSVKSKLVDFRKQGKHFRKRCDGEETATSFYP